MPKAKVTFIEQDAPMDEYGRALYAVARSIVRAHLDSMTEDDLTDCNCGADQVTMRQMSKHVRLQLDKGARGDGFEWAVHEAILGGEPKVIEPLGDAMKKCSRYLAGAEPNSLMFGQERSRYLGFLTAVVEEAGENAVLLPENRGRPYPFGPWVAKAAKGQAGENALTERIRKIWKTDLFVSRAGDERYLAATVKSNYAQLEGGRGLRLGIVPESTEKGHKTGVSWSENHGLWVVTLPDPEGFTGLFNDAYNAVARALCAMGKQDPGFYYQQASAKGRRLQQQLEKYETATVLDIADELDKAAQQDLVKLDTKLMGVNAPAWLQMKQMAPTVLAPRPRFEKLD